ncbi:MAG: ribosome small subunit-dependent GTPase A [Chitinispirillaceae bacterium]|nr:ribosome small subunit-dependent GTPase A [Chitinispirillaceae bacterium]
MIIKEGRIVEAQKNCFVINCQGEKVRADISGKMRHFQQRVRVGDIVEVKIIDRGNPQRGIIMYAKKPQTLLTRPRLANCSQVLCICTLKEPPLNFEHLDRLLFSAHVNNLRPCIVFNKIDILDEKEKEELKKITDAYKQIGYDVLWTSAKEKTGIDRIIDYCTGNITACIGESGVGKSSLLSVVFPDVEFKTGEISEATEHGKHTTTFIRLLELPDGGYIADTPGVSSLELPLVDEKEVMNYFPEFGDYIGKCHYSDCIHDKEPNCLISEKVKEGKILEWRYNHYLKFYYEILEKNKKLRKKQLKKENKKKKKEKEKGKGGVSKN